MGAEAIGWTDNGLAGSTSWLVGQYGLIDVWLFSTPATIEIINSPELVGVPFQDRLNDGLSSVLRVLMSRPGGIADAPCDVLYILRGGLNFSLHNVLSKEYGKDVEVSFQSSQRTTDDEGRLLISEDSYSKWNVHDNAIQFIGDICATGTTMERAINAVMLEHSRRGTSPKEIVVVTIGTDRLLDVLPKRIASLGAEVREAGLRISVVYLEGIFSLFGKHKMLSTTHLPSTDFLRKGAPCSYALEMASLDDPRTFFERCAIYDGGSRAFEPKVYRSNLRTYWERVAALPKALTSYEFLTIKTDLLGYEQSFDQWRKGVLWWEREGEAALRALHRKGNGVVASLRDMRLVDLAEKRLKSLK